MQGLISLIAWLARAGVQIYARKWGFLGLFCVLFFAMVFVLAQFDLLPEIKSVSGTSQAVLSASPHIATSARTPLRVELPINVAIPTLKLATSIENPNTTDIAALDSLLLKGVVRYPTSAKLGETGNVVLFGHSSYLPIVKNQAYKTFNGIQKLVAGDTIVVSSSGTSYTYRVRSVAKENADDNSAIPLVTVEKILTLVTCDSFGAKTDRFVVVADFVESHSVSN